MNIAFKKAFEYKVIYVFTIEDDVHRGLVKIGDATLNTENSIDSLTPNSRELNQAALKRIKSYTNTAGLTPKLLHVELAIRTVREKDGSISIKAFRDHNVHEVLKNSGIDNVTLGEATGREWFAVDLDTAKKAIDAVKQNYANLSNSDVVKHTPIVFRPEQRECIEKVVKHFKKANRFLINAKMRYGKTFVSLEIVKRCKFEKTIILTHRPVVNDGWYEDFTKIFYGEKDYIYGSKTNGNTVDELLCSGKKFVYFASVQDLRGSSQVGGKFDKNDIIFQTKWDCVIVDEAHEGTTTALGEDTVKAVVKEESDTKFLALSGTPFNILSDYDENSVYTWDYIMEQECKSEWDKLHFGDSNPYEELPELRIYTYALGDILTNSNYITFEDKAFNFREFFRTWTGDFSMDYAAMPETAQEGDFVYEADVWSFLNLMVKEDVQSCYPYANEEYRNLFKHSLWMVPGVKEARALKKLMLKHPVFGNGMFDIVNVAGSGDEEEKDEEALAKVRKAIKNAGENYTITLSCGKLTTGVTVKEWTAVFMLSGTYSTSAANYLQTIFRVQSPCNENGKIKETSYVFDFAPDRTLKMVSNAVSVSAKAGKTKSGDKQIMGKFLNYCPVIAISGSKMQEYSATRLLQQLKKAYADKVVRNGFDDSNLYNDELLKLQAIDIKKFDELKRIIGTSKATSKLSDITVNDQGLTNEEYEEVEKLKKKSKKELTPEEKARLEELKKMKKLRSDAISILRGISIRMPLLIYGADIPYDEEITLNRFVDIVDDSSWDEFMPNGITKAKFKEFQKYYDEEIFIAAGRRIRNIAKEADTLEPTERVKKIASLFSYFKNPDKETVLTPWRVVNKHMSDCLGGWDFFDEDHRETLNQPRFVDQGEVTKNVLGKLDTQILEINSKTGLYPLYVTYSVYRTRCELYSDNELTLQKKQELWMETVSENIFVICKTPMAKAITQRTLTGFSGIRIKAHYFDNLINIMQNKPELFIEKTLKASYWKKKGKTVMKFDAVVGNPPYMEMDGGAQASATPIYQHFIMTGKKLAPKYMSFIIPTRWYTGGKKLDDFRDNMLNDPCIHILHDCLTPEDVFPNTNIRGGVCYFLWDKEYDNTINFTRVITHKNNQVIDDVLRPMKIDGLDVFMRDAKAITILNKVSSDEQFSSIASYISGRKPFGFESNFVKSKDFHSTPDELIKPIYCYGKGQTLGYIEENKVTVHTEWIDMWKIFVSRANNIGTELNDDNLNTFTGAPGTVCTESYMIIGIGLNLCEVECGNVTKYFYTKFARYMHGLAKASQDATSKTYRFVPVQDFSMNSDIDWTQSIDDIDKQLYSKYGLSESEIQHIEAKIKPMN